MSKIGVGVGEDFPVDAEDRAKSDGAQAEDLGTCRHAKRHEAWRRFRHQMHDEWHARRRAMRDSLNSRDAAEAIHDFRDKHLHHLVIGGLAVIGLAALFGALRHRE